MGWLPILTLALLLVCVWFHLRKMNRIPDLFQSSKPDTTHAVTVADPNLNR